MIAYVRLPFCQSFDRLGKSFGNLVTDQLNDTLWSNWERSPFEDHGQMGGNLL